MVKLTHFISKETENNKCYEPALQGHSKSTWALREHGHWSKRGTRALEGHLVTRVLERGSSIWAVGHLETFCLADSLSLNVYHWFFKESNHLRAIFSKIDEIVVFSLK